MIAPILIFGRIARKDITWATFVISCRPVQTSDIDHGLWSVVLLYLIAQNGLMCVQTQCFSSLLSFLSLNRSVYFCPAICFLYLRYWIRACWLHDLLLTPTLLASRLFTFVRRSGCWVGIILIALVHKGGLLLLQEFLHVNGLRVDNVIRAYFDPTSSWLF
jgi:hypothetical protein